MKFSRSPIVLLARCFALALAVQFGGTAPALAQGKAKSRSAQPKISKAALADELFARTDLVRLELEIPGKEMDVLKKYQWTFGPQQEREKVRMTVREAGVIYTNVTAQLKGAAGSFRSIDDKPAFTLNFDKFADGQHFHGLEKLSLNNSVQDPSYLHEQFSREVFLRGGVPVPRATHARVTLNGKDLGLYVLVEGWDREFLKRHFKSSRGHLYDGGFIKDINDELPVNAGEAPQGQPDRVALAAAIKEADLARRREALEKILDVDRFLSFLALDVMLWNWDGYALNRNNWRLYSESAAGKMVFMPHGLDQMFWKPDGSILPPMQGLAAKAVLEVPELRARYFARLKQFRASIFDPAALTNRVRQIAAKIRPALSAGDAKEFAEHEKAVEGLCAGIVQRAASLDRQLARPIEPMRFDADGAAWLAADWESKSVFGRPTLTRANEAGPKGALQFRASDGSSIGSWRTSVWLEKGRYRIEGKIHAKGLAGDPGDPRPGAGFRLKSNRPENYLTGDADGKLHQREFHVQDPLTEVQILCEVRAAAGEASFDLASLRLVRLPHASPK